MMGYAFKALAPEYTALLVHMKITREREVNETADRLLRFVDEGRYAEVSAKTGVPQIIMATSFEREAGSNFRLSPAQGDPWDKVSHDVPHGRGPFHSWAAAAIDAYHLDHLDAVGAANWSWERACFEEELFNGFGPRMHGRHSGYLWSGSTAYTGGKYVADDVWNPHAIDEQLGVIPVMYRMVQIRPMLTLPIAFPSTTSAPTPPETPRAAPTGLRNVAALQAALNTLGADPQLEVDGNYGRYTKRAVLAFQRANGLEVDGIAGIDTWMVINSKLKANKPTEHLTALQEPKPDPIPTPAPMPAPAPQHQTLFSRFVGLFKKAA